MVKTVLFFILSLLSLTCASDTIVRDQDDDDVGSSSKNKAQVFNFASQAAGAVVLDKSASAKGYHNLLNDDKDKYGISPCDEKKWVVIGLSEEVQITAVEIHNYEKYSSLVKDFQLLASSAYPTDEWINLGTYTALPIMGAQSFNITELSEAHTRYLKVRFLTHYSDEALCTLSQIKVFGTTVIAAFQKEVEQSDNSMRDMLNQLSSEEDYAEILRAAEAVDSVPAAVQAEQVIHTSQQVTKEVNVESTTEISGSTEDSNLLKTPAAEGTPSTAADQDAKTASASERVEGSDSSSLEKDAVCAVGQAEAGSTCPLPDPTEVSLDAATATADPAPASTEPENVDPTPLGTAEVAVTATSVSASSTLDISSTSALALPAGDGERDAEPPAVPLAPAGNGEANPFAPFSLADKVKQLFFPVSSGEAAEVAVNTSTAGAEATKSAEAAAEEPGVETGTETAASATVPAGEKLSGVAVEDTTNSDSHTNTDHSTPEPGGESSGTPQQPAKEDPVVQVTASTTSTTSISSASASTAPNSEIMEEKPTVVPVAPNHTTIHTEGSSGSSSGPSPATGSSSSTTNATPAPDKQDTAATAQPHSLTVKTATIRTTVLPANSSLQSTSGSVVSIGGTNVTVPSLPTLPTASFNCYEALNFTEFSRKMRAKLQQYGATGSNSTTGNFNGTGIGVGVSLNSTATEEGSGSREKERDKDKDSNVFKSLMQKIKTLEMNNAIAEMYTIQLSECYRTVSKELMQRTQAAASASSSARPYRTGVDGAVRIADLLALAGKVLFHPDEAQKEGLNRVFLDLCGVYLESNLAAVLVCLAGVVIGLVVGVGVLVQLAWEARERRLWPVGEDR